MSNSVANSFKVEHTSRFHYDSPITSSVMLVRLHPRDDQGQRVINFTLDVEPQATVVEFTDSFDNICHVLGIQESYSELTVKSSAQIESVDEPEFLTETGLDSWTVLDNIADPIVYWDYLNPSTLTRSNGVLEAFMNYRGIRKGSDPALSILEASYSLFDHFCYVPGSTSVDSSIDKILKSGRGVCQDYTHVLIAIGRAWGIPSRYVSGYIRLDPMEGDEVPISESHCWAEFLLPYSGWVGIDPVNDSLVDRRHIRVAIGRDYADVPPTKGVVFGGGRSEVDVQVIVVQTGEKVVGRKIDAALLGGDQ